MRALSPALAACLIAGVASTGHAANKDTKNKERCASFGFEEGTDAFANCVMKFSLKQDVGHLRIATPSFVNTERVAWAAGGMIAILFALPE